VAFKAISTKLKLTDKQATLMAQHAGYSRWVYNWGLALWKTAYSSGIKPNLGAIEKVFTSVTKPQYPWMAQLSSKVYQYALRNLGEAFNSFFKGIGEFPKFKKKGSHDSFTIDNSGRPIKLGGTRHFLPFIGGVKTFDNLPECQTKKVTVSREADGWYVSFCYEFWPAPTPKTVGRAGVDLGVKTLATLSTGQVFESLKPYRLAKRKLKRLQRQLSRHQTGSRNWEKAKRKLAKAHQRGANIRKNTLHQLTSYLAKNHSQIVIEDLNVSGMMANHKLAGAVADMGFYSFRRQVEYKCSWYGAELIVASRWYPSSQLCSNCHHQQPMTPEIRTFRCSCCGFEIDRDLNAAINLENYPTTAAG
jgi:putative transposase